MISLKTIPGVYGGVSQIIPELREVNECELLENCFTDITMTTARPRAIKKLSLLFFSNNIFNVSFSKWEIYSSFIESLS